MGSSTSAQDGQEGRHCWEQVPYVVGVADVGGHELCRQHRCQEPVHHRGQGHQVAPEQAAYCVCGHHVHVLCQEGKARAQEEGDPGVVIRQRKAIRRKDGTVLYFEDNAGVIVNPKGEIRGLPSPVRWPRSALTSGRVSPLLPAPSFKQTGGLLLQRYTFVWLGGWLAWIKQ